MNGPSALRTERPIGIAHTEATVDAFAIGHVARLDIVDALDHILQLKPLIEHFVYDPMRRVRFPETSGCHATENHVGSEECNEAVGVLDS
jgi:hypothetical protein